MKKHLLSVLLICSSCIASQSVLASTDGDKDHPITELSAKDQTSSIKSDNQNALATTETPKDLATSNTEGSLSAKENKEPLTYDDVKKIITDILPTFSGYLQTGYIWNDKNAGDNSSFQMKRMRLFIDKKISNYFDFRTQFEIFSGSTDSEYKKKVMSVLDAYIDGHINKMFNFRVGQYALPLGYENFELSARNLETIDFSNINLRMVCRNAVSTPNLIDYGRDIGIMMYGDLFRNNDKKFSYLSYNLSLTNGNLPTLNDNNKAKDFVGRLTIKPIEKLSIIGSYNFGEYRRLGETQEETHNYLKMDRILAGAWYYDPNGLSLRSEYGHIESKKANVREDGFYVLAAYKIQKFLPAVRWDMYRDHKNEYSPNNRDAIMLGCIYQIDKNVKLQAAYNYSIYTDKVKDKTLGTRDHNGNGIQIMCFANF